MKSIGETIYLHAPRIVQDLLITTKGYSLEAIRHGGDYEAFLREVLRRQEWTLEDFSNHQLNALRKIIRLSLKHVPYYRNTFREVGFCPDDINSLEDIVSIPMLDKDDVRSDPLALVDGRLNTRKLLVLHTTGTTGTPLKIYANKTARQWNYAFFDGYLKSLGVDRTKKRATLGGRIIVHPNQSEPPFWRYSRFQRNLLFSSYHLTDKNLPFYFERLREYEPEIIDAYPSSLYVLAKYIIDQDKNGEISPKAIITSGETILEDQREIIEEAFQCRVSDQYGCAEMCIFAGQCGEGHYHYRPDYSLVETVKENGEIADSGEMGEIVCTGFINEVMPLIRYRIGDIGIISKEICSCGLNTPHFEKLIGRTDDFILTPDGRHVGRLSPVLKGFPVKEAQYIQRSTDLVIVRLVQDGGFTPKTERDLIKEIQKRLGYAMGIEFEFVDHISRGPGGKLKTVISEIQTAGQA
jgi:phenylacetate-CoA ligase